MAKYIFITGGVVSGLGKGIAAASLGRLLKARGLKVALQKFDPYLNIDPGTMNPYQHGEVFVTEDGAETDLDLGHYERFTDEDLTVDSSITSGKVYWSVLSQEREGAFLGGTVQVIPHITGEIKERIYRVGRREEVDVVITEDGTTILPVSKVSFGFASGGTDFDGKNAANKDLFGGGSGAGVNIQPVAFLVVKDGCVRTIQLSDNADTINRALTMLPELVDKVAALIKKDEKKEEPAAPAEQ